RLIVVIAALLTPFLLPLTFLFGDFFDSVAAAREGSTNTRLMSYRLSYELTIENNPLLGIGVKPRTDSLGIPIGSHSTIFATLVRGGLLACSLAIVAFFISPLS